ncbi:MULTISPECIES: type II toxin-antitoxin system RelE/ParE family toxin [Acidithiobacillus]|jgi:putative addiction module killer protein|uniref:Addiction module antitoxin RelB n=2 Tax=Acidithiobacillus TaxID=119977 RepID=A0A179BHQ0_ACIFR|nr:MULTISPECIES: type II toxin-antitoxin system RelE/ParE family toxin [Acidithiobacillus]MBU2846412.1 type II toxin-antitoxin system RelE/ParE family toxin [Acidithiobacillus ferriphilus]MEB8474449.1 type II toxin-antitoxin system RelE/ParE family toxin [Acidithiobacillus ferriphilus]MEB8488348.1 type II toxin-antitoxin system RelE/ParE family toxin [Acidithiobacillus ferriphilus]MEB8490671.1 type II toxin-antitoxin system RelE/ParE family toxin [Acidithiobacillus ferriphilus]MEB8493569.1 typ
MVNIKTTATFDRRLHGLRDRRARARVQVRIDRMELAHFDDCEPVGEGVSEMRIHYGPRYRVYFKRFGLEFVVLLAGGDKSTQSADIALALKLARQMEG